MNHLIFILKTTGISLFISSLFGILAGLFWSMKEGEHPHQIFPNWLITAFFAAFTALIVGLIVGGMLSFLDKADLKKSLLYTNGIVFFIVVALIVYSIHNAG